MVVAFCLAVLLRFSSGIARGREHAGKVDVQTANDAEAQLRAGLARANLYNSDACLQLRSKSLYERLYKTIEFKHERDTRRDHTPAVLTFLEQSRLTKGFKEALPEATQAQGWNLLFVLNLKVASTTMHLWGAPTFSLERGTVHHTCLVDRQASDQAKARRQYAPCGSRTPHDEWLRYEIPADYGPVVPVAFTDDPLRVFFRGLKESFCKPGHVGWKAVRHHWENQHSALAGVRNLTSVDAVRAFIADMELARAVSPHARHAWPQAVKLDVEIRAGTGPLHFNFIGDLSHFESGLRGIIHGFRKPKSLNSAEKSSCKLELDRSIRQLTDEDLRPICKLIAMDYTCFNYTLPAFCH